MAPPQKQPSPLPLRRRHFVAGLAGLTLTPRLAQAAPLPCSPGAWTKKGAVLNYPGPPTDGWIQNFTSAAEPLEGDRWRVWCSLSGGKEIEKNIGYAEGVPGQEMRFTWAALSEEAADPSAPLAITGLPAGWRPVQVVPLKLKDGRQRLYFWAHGEKVVRYLAADSEDGRHYRVADPLRPCIYHPADRAVDGAAAVEAGLSRRGKKQATPVKGEPLAPAGLISNDATNVYQLPDGTFEMYSVGLMEVPKDDPRYFPQDNIPGLVRVIDRYVSQDGLRWQGRRRVITPDAEDPVDQQFYYLSVTHTDRGRVGLLGHYRLSTQTIDLEWCFSEDGLHWQRPARQPWLPRGQAPAADSYMLHAPHALVRRQDQWWLFYTGGNFAHNHQDAHGEPDRSVMLAVAKDIWR